MEEILKEKNIFTNCKPEDKISIISKIGKILYDNGYITEKYIEAMMKKELVMNTYIGNYIALPHGVEDSRSEVLHSGMVMMIFPEGTEWNGETAKIVIGLACTGDDHLNILSTIAEKLSDEDMVEKVVSSDANTIWKMFHNI